MYGQNNMCNCAYFIVILSSDHQAYYLFKDSLIIEMVMIDPFSFPSYTG